MKTWIIVVAIILVILLGVVLYLGSVAKAFIHLATFSPPNQTDINSECLATNIVGINVTSNSTGYNITLKRNAGGMDNLGGIIITIINTTTTSDNSEFGYPLKQQETHTSYIQSSITNASAVHYTSWFTDSSGSKQVCSETQSIYLH